MYALFVLKYVTQLLITSIMEKISFQVVEDGYIFENNFVNRNMAIIPISFYDTVYSRITVTIYPYRKN